MEDWEKAYNLKASEHYYPFPRTAFKAGWDAVFRRLAVITNDQDLLPDDMLDALIGTIALHDPDNQSDPEHD